MEFKSIIEAVEPFIYSVSGPENDICGIAYDSRAVRPGFAFVAILAAVRTGMISSPTPSTGGPASSSAKKSWTCLPT